jgi:hypothetical protein
MRKIIPVALAILAFGILLLAEQNFGLNRTRMVTFRENVTIGAQALPAGDYKVTHVMDGDKHIMVFKQGGNEFRISCTMTPLPRKSPQTYFVYEQRGDAKVLTGMVFKGDNLRHQFELQP